MSPYGVDGGPKCACCVRSRCSRGRRAIGNHALRHAAKSRARRADSLEVLAGVDELLAFSVLRFAS